MHSHAIQAASASPAQGPTGVPSLAVGFAAASGVTPYISAPAVMAQTSITVTGGNSTHDNMMPTLVMNYCIALEGIYPTQP